MKCNGRLFLCFVPVVAVVVVFNCRMCFRLVDVGRHFFQIFYGPWNDQKQLSHLPGGKHTNLCYPVSNRVFSPSIAFKIPLLLLSVNICTVHDSLSHELASFGARALIVSRLKGVLFSLKFTAVSWLDVSGSDPAYSDCWQENCLLHLTSDKKFHLVHSDLLGNKGR